MKYTIQVVITTDEGQTETRDIACVEREDLTPTTLGLTLAEGKAILKALQAVVVEQQMTAYLETQRPCAHCGHRQRSKGYHTTQVRTVFGTIPVHSLRLYQCPCQSDPSDRPGRSVPWLSCSQNLSRQSCCFWRRSGPPWCRMASPPSSYRRCCRSMTRWPPAPFGSMSSRSPNGWSRHWGRNSGRLSTAARRSGAACPSPMARSRSASMGATSVPNRSKGGSRSLPGRVSSPLRGARSPSSRSPVRGYPETVLAKKAALLDSWRISHPQRSARTCWKTASLGRGIPRI